MDAALNAAEIAAEEVRSAALEVLQRNNKFKPSSSSSKPSNTNSALLSQLNETDAQVTMDAILLAKTSVADAFDAAESALSSAEAEIQRARTELENAKRDATLGLAMAERAVAGAAIEAQKAAGQKIMPCVSRFEGRSLVLDR